MAAIKGIAIAFAAAVMGGGLWWMVSPRITERDIAFQINRGKLVDAHVEPGVKMNALLPHIDYVRLPGTQLETKIQATKESQINVRTKEDARIYGDFSILYRINRTDANLPEVFNTLKIDDEDDIPQVLEPKIQALGISAVINVYKEIPIDSLNEDAFIGVKATKVLQASLNTLGFTYVEVMGVIPSGVGLSDKANTDLEAIVSEQRKLDLQTVQKKVAENAIDLTRKQTAVTIRALEDLRKAGIAESQLVQAYYLQLLRDGDAVGKPFVPGPIPGTGVGAINK